MVVFFMFYLLVFQCLFCNALIVPGFFNHRFAVTSCFEQTFLLEAKLFNLLWKNEIKGGFITKSLCFVFKFHIISLISQQINTAKEKLLIYLWLLCVFIFYVQYSLCLVVNCHFHLQNK